MSTFKWTGLLPKDLALVGDVEPVVIRRVRLDFNISANGVTDLGHKVDENNNLRNCFMDSVFLGEVNALARVFSSPDQTQLEDGQEILVVFPEDALESVLTWSLHGIAAEFDLERRLPLGGFTATLLENPKL